MLPAFQLQQHSAQVPQNKAELLAMGDKVSQVHPEAGRDIAHKYTDYPRWRTATEIYEAKYSMPYEPYFVTNKRVPRYDPTFVGYGNDKTGQCYEVAAAGMKYLVLPQSFVFHVDHPRGEWLSTDQEWVVRSPATLVRFYLDVQRRYALKVEGQAQAVAGAPGENCSQVCTARGLGCRPDLGAAVNTCAALKAAFGDKCGGKCADIFYGYDLPSYNTEQRQCLTNSNPEDFPVTCDVHNGASARLCPCGTALRQWLTAEYVVGTLSALGSWPSVSPSLTGAGRPRRQPRASRAAGG